MSTALLVLALAVSAAEPYRVKPAHPRLFIDDVKAMAERCAGSRADDWRAAKERADRAVRRGGIESH